MTALSGIPWCEKYRPSEFSQIVLEPNNRMIFDNILSTNRFPHLLFYGPPGVGKCMAKDTPIMLSNGETKMVQDITVHDKLMGDDGTERNILALGRGREKMYRIEQADGDDYIVNESHILSLKMSKSVHNYNKNDIVDICVKEYLRLPNDIQTCLKGYKVKLDFEEQEVSLYPYALGYWLGNTTQKVVCMESLEKYDLINNKHIPYEYKITSRENRLALLAGLLGNDGHYDSEMNAWQMTQTNKTLVNDIVFLVRSLGMKATTCKDQITITGTGLEEIPIALEKNEAMPVEREDCLNTDITVVALDEDTYYGFQIDGNSRYLLGDFTVTHNTTSAENLIHAYQQAHQKNQYENIIHLNASDERGIEVIRNQIYQFVKSKNMFESGYKFVILDEVDYMTKNAQQALKNLMQSCNENVRFCLICNYICKIDESLKNEFICIRFNQLPERDILQFLASIAEQENVKVDTSVLKKIQNMYQSDIRSMVNFLQLHQKDQQWERYVFHDALWEELHQLFLKGDMVNINKWIQHVTVESCNMDIRSCIKKYFNYMIQHNSDFISHEFLDEAEIILHSSESERYLQPYFVTKLLQYYKKLKSTI